MLREQAEMSQAGADVLAGAPAPQHGGGPQEQHLSGEQQDRLHGRQRVPDDGADAPGVRQQHRRTSKGDRTVWSRPPFFPLMSPICCRFRTFSPWFGRPTSKTSSAGWRW